MNKTKRERMKIAAQAEVDQWNAKYPEIGQLQLISDEVFNVNKTKKKSKLSLLLTLKIAWSLCRRGAGYESDKKHD